MTGATRRQDAQTGTSAGSTDVLRHVSACLAETARALTREPDTERVRSALARLEDARAALLPLLREQEAADADAGALTATRELELLPDEAASRGARAFCRSVLGEWSLEWPSAEAVVDVASELATNAARHTSGQIRLRLERAGDDLLVSAWDDGPGAPQLLPNRPGTSDRGIGLHWVASLTVSWGWTQERGGKRVWGVVRLRPR